MSSRLLIISLYKPFKTNALFLTMFIIIIRVIFFFNSDFRWSNQQKLHNPKRLHVTALRPEEISEIQTQQDTKEKIDVPERFEHSIQRLVRKNNDLFAKKDSDLVVTDTAKMKIEPGDYHPIKCVQILLNVHKEAYDET